MNASALLKSQGWRGHGHTLHTTDDSTGLAKPLLISRKDNKLGIGQKQHGGASDQWWLSALDEQLKGLDTSQRGVVVQTVTSGRLNAAVATGAGKYRGAASLYASFVRGGMLEGTIRPDESTDDAATTPEVDEERRPPPEETKEERRARREARRLRKAERAAQTATETQEVDSTRIRAAVAETEEERRARKEAKRRKREEKRRRAAAGG